MVTLRLVWHCLIHGLRRNQKIYLGDWTYQFREAECSCGIWIRLHPDGEVEFL
jgi:hypothetical protein